MAVKSVLSKDISLGLAGGGGSKASYASVTGAKLPTTAGTYANGIAATLPKVSVTQPLVSIKNPSIGGVGGVSLVGGGSTGGVTKEGAITGNMGVTKMPTLLQGAHTAKYADGLAMATTLPKASTMVASVQPLASAKDNATTPVAKSTQTASEPASAAEPATPSTPATYEEWLTDQRELLDKRKAEADRQAEAAKERAAVDAQASYEQNKATYGTNAETLAQMGLSGGGYSDYINAQAYAQKRADVQQANVTEQAAKAQNNATYEDALAELNKGAIEHKEKQDATYASLWERAIDPNSNYTAENIEALGREYGLPDSQIAELKNVISQREQKVEEQKAKDNSDTYAGLLGYANNGTYSAEQIAAIGREKGLSEQQIADLSAAATTYKNNQYKSNYGSYMTDIENGKMSKNILDTALKNDYITQEQYNDLLNKYQTSFYDFYSSSISSNFGSVDTDTIDKSYQRGEISAEQYNDLKNKYNSAVASAITSATLFYQSGVKLDENNAKALAERLKNTGWLSDDNKSKVDSFLSEDYKKEDDEGGCYAKGTLITVADGSQVPVEDLKEGDEILVFNHFTGEVDSAPILYMYYEGEKDYDVLKLHFDKADDIEILYGHGFFDVDLNKYVLIKSSNVEEYIGHRFYRVERKDGKDTMEVISLTGYDTYRKETECYCAVSIKHLNSIANGVLTIADDQNRPPQSVIGFCNLFDLDENHKIDAEKMAADIETYGIFSYDDFCQMAPDHADISDLFFGIGGEYIKIAFGKGLMSMERLSTYIGIGAEHRSEQNEQ